VKTKKVNLFVAVLTCLTIMLSTAVPILAVTVTDEDCCEHHLEEGHVHDLGDLCCDGHESDSNCIDCDGDPCVCADEAVLADECDCTDCECSDCDTDCCAANEEGEAEEVSEQAATPGKVVSKTSLMGITGLSGFAGFAPMSAGTGTLEWSATSFTNLYENGEYIDGYGLQRASTATQLEFSPISNELHVTVLDGGWRQFNLQTGELAGGSEHYFWQGFSAEPNTEYRVEVDARVASGEGQLRFRGNAKLGGTLDGSERTLTTSTQTVSWTFTQAPGTNGGNITFDTGSTTVNNAIIISAIRIYDITPPSGGDVPTFTWEQILTEFLASGGGHGVTTVSVTAHGINVTGITANHMGLGVDIAKLRALNSDNKNIVITTTPITGSVTGQTWGPRLEILPNGDNWSSELHQNSITSIQIAADNTNVNATGSAHRLIVNSGSGTYNNVGFTITGITVGGVRITPEPPTCTHPSWTDDGNAATHKCSACPERQAHNTSGANGSCSICTRAAVFTAVSHTGASLWANTYGNALQQRGIEIDEANRARLAAANVTTMTIVVKSGTPAVGARFLLNSAGGTTGGWQDHALTFSGTPLRATHNLSTAATNGNAGINWVGGYVQAGVEYTNTTAPFTFSVEFRDAAGVLVYDETGFKLCAQITGHAALAVATCLTPAAVCPEATCNHFNGPQQAALGHNFSTVTDTHHSCSRVGCSVSELHTYGANNRCTVAACNRFNADHPCVWTSLPAAHCTNNITVTRTCTFTGCPNTSTETVPAGGHIENNGVCTRSGCSATTCGMCSTLTVWSWGNNAGSHWAVGCGCTASEAHTFSNGRCTTCNMVDPRTPCGICGVIGNWTWGGNDGSHWANGCACDTLPESQRFAPHTFNAAGICTTCGFNSGFTACGMCGNIGNWSWGGNSDVHWADGCNCTGSAAHSYNASGVCICGATGTPGAGGGGGGGAAGPSSPCGMCGVIGPWRWGGNADSHWADNCSCTGSAAHSYDASGRCICGATGGANVVAAPQDNFREEDFINAGALIDDLLASIAAGETPTIDLTSAGNVTIISADVFHAIASSGVDVLVVLPSGYSFTIIASSITGNVGSFDLNIEVIIKHIDVQLETIGGGKVDVSANSIVFLPNFHGEFGFELVFTITPEQLAEAGIDVSTVRLYHVCGVGNVTDKGEPVVNDDGSISFSKTHASFYVLSNSPPVTAETGTAIIGGDVTDGENAGGEQGGSAVAPVQQLSIAPSQPDNVAWYLIAIAAAAVLAAAGATILLIKRRQNN